MHVTPSWEACAHPHAAQETALGARAGRGQDAGPGGRRDLRRRQPHAIRLVHDRHHLLARLLQLLVEVDDVRPPPPQDRVRVLRDGHGAALELLRVQPHRDPRPRPNSKCSWASNDEVMPQQRGSLQRVHIQ